MGSDGQSIGREIAGVDVGTFERAIAGADRDSLCRAMAAMRASFEGANRVDAVCAVAELLRALFVRGQLDHRRLDEDVFLETIRTASLRSDCSGAFEVLEQFLLSLCAPPGRSLGREIDRQVYIHRAIEYMCQAYGNPGLRIEEVANYAYISTSYLTLLIKRETGKTFGELLTEIRMEQAERLLTETNRKTYEVAARCGFANTTYFSTVFRRIYGMTPTEYRKRN